MTRREVLERLYEEGSFEGEHRDIHPDRIEIALQELAQIEESERLTEEEMVKAMEDYQNKWLDEKMSIFLEEYAHAIYEAQGAKNERGKRVMDTCRNCRYWGFREMIQKPYGYGGDTPCLRCIRFTEPQDLFEESQPDKAKE